jgi:hypothetical protein
MPALGLVGVAAQAVAGAKILSDHRLIDPSTRLANEIAENIAQQYALQLTAVTEKGKESDHFTRGRTIPNRPTEPPRPMTDLLLEVRTSDWAMRNIPGYWNRYKVHYTVEVKLTDTRDQRLLAAGECVGDDPEAGKATAGPTDDEMLANNAAVLKREINRAADRCIALYGSRLFYTSSAGEPIRSSAAPISPSPPQPAPVDGGAGDRGSPSIHPADRASP